MKARILMIVCLALSVAVVGCEKNASGDAKDDEAKAEAPSEEADDEAAEADEEAAAEGEEEAEEEAPAEKVEVAKGGTEFDPAVEPEQLPDGAYYCDMGTVHWASTEKPEDGKCPLCGMKLKQYDAAGHAKAKEGAVEAKDDHGHDHEDGDHAHEGDDHHGDEDHAHEGDDHGHAH
ncbi:MAG: hypothetical protein ACQEVA_08155 [Myxococcota bacterium]